MPRGMNKWSHPGHSVSSERIPPRLLNRQQVADRLGRGVTQMLKSGILLEIPYVKLTPKAEEQYDIQDVDRWIETRKQGGLQ